MADSDIDYTEEIDKLLEDGLHTKRTLAHELLELRLVTVPLLQERITILEEERKRLLSDITALETEIDCGTWTDSDRVEDVFEGLESYVTSENSDHTEESSENSAASVSEYSWSSRPRLPSIIDLLHIVFQHLLPGLETLDLSTLGGPKDSWCRSIRMKKSLARVCKAWHAVALGFLYRDVVLRRVSQIADFARTVSADPLTFGSLVRRLVFACLLPDGVSHDVQDAINTVLRHCHSVSQVSFGGFQDMSLFGGEVILHQVQHDTPDAWRTQVQAGEATFTIWRMHIPSSAFMHLRSLEVSLWSQQADAYANELDLPLLDTLILRYSWAFFREHRVVYHYPVTWMMPSLKHLRFRCSIQELPVTTSLWEFLDIHGLNLLSLGFNPFQLRAGVPENNINITIVSLLNKCPSITHLVFQPATDVELSQQSLPHTIQHIDVLLPAAENTRELVEAALAKSALIGPGRQCVRFFESTLVAILPNLPFSPFLHTTRAEYDALGLGDTFVVDGHRIYVVPRQCLDMEVPELIFLEAVLE